MFIKEKRDGTVKAEDVLMASHINNTNKKKKPALLPCH